jgi:hypothetical protein
MSGRVGTSRGSGPEFDAHPVGHAVEIVIERGLVVPGCDGRRRKRIRFD